MSISIGPLEKKRIIQEQLPIQTVNPSQDLTDKLVASFQSNKFFTIGETLERRAALEEAGKASRPLNLNEIEERKEELTLGGLMTVKPGETEEQVRLKQQWFLKNRELEFVLKNSPDGVFPEILSFGAGMLGSMAHHVDFMMNFIPLQLLTARGVLQTTAKGAVKKGLAKQFNGTPLNVSKFMGQAQEFILNKAPLYKGARKVAGVSFNKETKKKVGKSFVEGASGSSKASIDEFFSSSKLALSTLAKNELVDTMFRSGQIGLIAGALNEAILITNLNDQGISYTQFDTFMNLAFSSAAGAGLGALPKGLTRLGAAISIIPFVGDITGTFSAAGIPFFMKILNEGNIQFGNVSDRTRYNKLVSKINSFMTNTDDRAIQDYIDLTDPVTQKLLNEVVRIAAKNDPGVKKIVESLAQEADIQVDIDRANALRSEVVSNFEKLTNPEEQKAFLNTLENVLRGELTDDAVRKGLFDGFVALSEDVDPNLIGEPTTLFDNTDQYNRRLNEEVINYFKSSMAKAADEATAKSATVKQGDAGEFKEFIHKTDEEFLTKTNEDIEQLSKLTSLDTSKDPLAKQILEGQERVSEIDKSVKAARKVVDEVVSGETTFQKALEGMEPGPEKVALEAFAKRYQALVNKSLAPTSKLLEQVEMSVTRDLVETTIVKVRRDLLELDRVNTFKAFVNQFEGATKVDAINAYLSGDWRTLGKIKGLRNSVHNSSRLSYMEHVGGLERDLKAAKVWDDFRRRKISELDIYRAKWFLDKGVQIPDNLDKRALAVAQAIFNRELVQIATLNSLGSNIQKIAGRIRKRIHHIGRMKRDKETWVDYVSSLDVLYPEEVVTASQQREFLNSLFDTIIQDIDPDKPIAQLSTRVSRRRTLFFKSPESEHAYDTSTYSMKGLKDGLFFDVQQKANTIGIMRLMGPDPDRFFKRMLKEAGVKLEDAPAFTKGTFQQVTGTLDIPQNKLLNSISTVVRQLEILAFLPMATVSSLSDQANWRQVMQMSGIKRADRWALRLKSMRTIFDTDTDYKLFLNHLGAGVDGSLSSMTQWWGVQDGGTGALSKVVDIFWKFNGMNAWTEFHQGASIAGASNQLAHFSKVPIDTLSPEGRRIFDNYGFTPQEWDTMSRAVTEVDGKLYIDPDLIDNLSVDDVNSILLGMGNQATAQSRFRFKNDVKAKIRAYFTDTMDQALTIPDARTQAITKLGTIAGTPGGEASRLLTLFKSFSVASVRQNMRRMVYGRGAATVNDFIKNKEYGNNEMLQMIAYSSALGYTSLVIKDLLNDREPQSIADADTWQRSFNKGGAAGMLGDLITGQINSDYLLGPTFGTALDIGGELVEGDLLGAYRDVRRSMPLLTAPVISKAADYLVLDNVETFFKNLEEE